MYDDYPYPSYAYAQTHPDRLATIAHMFGLSPTPIQKCRVLEIGCGSAGNLLPMAEQLPHSTFVGIDPAPTAIAQGQHDVDALGLKNVHLASTSIEAFDDDGLFDYIICHGVWSWVPELARHAILQTCAKKLSVNGVAAISYNIYPGWHQSNMLRGILQRQRSSSASPPEQVAAARRQLKALSETTQNLGDARAVFLAREHARLQTMADAYVYYEYLHGENSPEWFEAFVHKAQTAGLRYLSNATINSMWPLNQPESVANAMRKCPNVVSAQQTLDILRNRRFRTTLLCRAESPVDMNLTPSRLSSLWFRANFNGEPMQGSLEEETVVSIVHNEGNSADIQGLALRRVLDALLQAAPKALSWTALLNLTNPTDAPRLGEGLLHLAFAHFLHLHTYNARVVCTLSTYPTASQVAQRLAPLQEIIADQWHNARPLPHAQRALIALLDGTRSLAELTVDPNQSELLETLLRGGYVSA